MGKQGIEGISTVVIKWSAYETCLCRELALQNIPFERQKPLPVSYKGVDLDAGYRLDILVANQVVVELKAVLKDGIRRRVLGLKE